jgi:ComF family protein
MAGEIVRALPLTSHNMLQTVIQRHTDISLIPIPLHVSRLRTRGFNQAEVFGVCVAERFGILLETNVLKRVLKTQTQVSMVDRKARLANMHGAFAMTTNISVRGRSFIVFDDVFTTGATVRAATKTLKEAGASFVWAVTIAR